MIELNNEDLWNKFKGLYRAIVVETNDPLGMHRIRFKCPEMHDWNLEPEHCPWAVTSFEHGGKRCGFWTHPCIGDWIWISFEKGHAYGPIVVGFADPTRRKFYSLPSIYIKSPLPVDENGDAAEIPEDFDEDYLPADGRPMSIGRIDRYGNLDLMSSVGFFPVEHDTEPPDPDYDALQQSEFKQSNKKPKLNEPDVKYSLRMTKYGQIFLLSDQGYNWKKDGDYGEFTGDVEEDEDFEVERWKFYQKLLNEDEVKDHDARRISLITRYGHKFEMRDVGWAQPGPISSKSRTDDFGEAKHLSSENENDQRWIKLRTKGGMLLQLSDKGFHPQDDEFVKRGLLEEVGDKADNEQEWKDKDARWMRLVTRHGYKIVLDDCGSDSKDADVKENPRGNGILIKGRRSPGSGDDSPEGNPIGFFWEFNENDKTNQTTWGSPLGHVIQINDRHQYIMLASSKSDYPKEWKNLSENEFLLDAIVSDDQESKCHHLKIDHHNEYIRIKTRTGKGDDPDGDPVNPVDELGDINQGLEIRDGSKGDGSWVELVDSKDRNLWFWNKGEMIICHARQKPEPVEMMWWFDEKEKNLVIRHNEDSGKIQIFCNQPVEIVSKDNVNIHAAQKITLRGDQSVSVTAGGANFEVSGQGVSASVKMMAPKFVESSPSITPLEAPEEVSVPDKLSPEDRGKRYNDNLDGPIDVDEIRHNIQS